jgi:hypothetical protein
VIPLRTSAGEMKVVFEPEGTHAGSVPALTARKPSCSATAYASSMLGRAEGLERRKEQFRCVSFRAEGLAGQRTQ